MKKALKLISISSILLFAVLWVFEKYIHLNGYNTMDHRNTLVLIYLFASLKYFQLVNKDKDAIIKNLKSKLKEA